MLLTDDTQEIESDSYFTFHQPVAATTSASKVVEVSSIQRTTCEGRDLLFTVQAMDHLFRVDREHATHAVYWPLVFLNIMIGPYVVNGACSCARVGRAIYVIFY